MGCKLEPCLAISSSLQILFVLHEEGSSPILTLSASRKGLGLLEEVMQMPHFFRVWNFLIELQAAAER